MPIWGVGGVSHEIPSEQLSAIRNTKYVWLSHGHPDHPQADSLEQLRDKTILLSDHVGKRIHDSLREQGFDVRTMTDRQWYPLSYRVRVVCISDLNQDAVLLVDINGRLVFNRNDTSDHGWESSSERSLSATPCPFCSPFRAGSVTPT